MASLKLVVWDFVSHSLCTQTVPSLTPPFSNRTSLLDPNPRGFHSRTEWSTFSLWTMLYGDGAQDHASFVSREFHIKRTPQLPVPPSDNAHAKWPQLPRVTISDPKCAIDL